MKIPNLPSKYEVISEIGSGGMAHVYLAKNKQTGKKVAIKTLISDAKTVSTNKSRFREEMQLSQQIKSPYVVKFYEGRYDKTTQYLIMEYVDGKILKDYIEERGRLEVDKAVDFCIQLAMGFASIHDQDIIHRDLKSSNIMVTNFDEIKIIDFGIAIAPDTARYTQTGKVIGSVHYMAPELISQEEASVKSDIYALGVVLYEMLIGEPPFNGKDALDTAMKHKNEKMKAVNDIFPQIPQAVANIVAKATAKNKDQRYQSMRQFANALKKCLNQESALTKKVDFEEPKNKKNIWEIINSKIFIIGSVAFIVIIILIIVLAVTLD